MHNESNLNRFSFFPFSQKVNLLQIFSEQTSFCANFNALMVSDGDILLPNYIRFFNVVKYSEEKSNH